MEPSRWSRVEALLEVAFDLPAAEQRAYLDAQCGQDHELRREVESLLAGDRATAGFLEEGVRPELLSALVVERDAESMLAAGTRVGAYRVARLLGRGGMGEVYLADRADGQFEQRAAVKLIKRGMDSDQVLRRFLAERRILARLEHPHIARLLDGGVGPDGRPYFAMEYVEGVPVSSWAEARSLDAAARVRLFLDVAAAVEYAHRQLVVHRDLKPSNILVREDGRVALLDFGVAKLLETDFDAGAGHTDVETRVLTPEFAAPEQIRGEPVSMATDVYGLGAVLYHLLTGRPPLQAASSRSYVDLERAALEQEPPAPSRLAPSSAGASWTADLDTIVLKALRKTPEDRYASAAALSDDLHRLLAGRPILARAPARLYRLRRFVGRNRTAVLLSALVAVALIAGVAGVLWQARAAQHQAERAERVRDFVLGLFEGSDPNVAKGQSFKVRDLLDRGARRVEATLKDQPDLAAEFAQTLSTLYEQNGLYAEAEAAARQAVDLRRTEYGAHDLRYAAALVVLGEARHAQNRLAEAGASYREALAIQDAARAEPAHAAGTRRRLAQLALMRGRFDEAESLLLPALAALQGGGARAEVTRAAVLNTLGRTLQAKHQLEPALAHYRQALAIRERAFGSDHVLVAETTTNLATALEAAGQLREAAQLYRAALEINRKLLGNAHPYVGVAANNLANVLRVLGAADEAATLSREAVAIREQAYGIDDPGLVAFLYGLAYALLDAGETEQAESAAARALKLIAAGGATRSRGVVSMRLIRARAAALAGRIADAEAELAAAEQALDAPLPAEFFAARAEIRCAAARHDDALADFDRAVKAQSPSTRPWLGGRTQLQWGLCLTRAGRSADAPAHLRLAIAQQEPALGADHPDVRAARRALASIEHATP